jgi:hypothetical protein
MAVFLPQARPEMPQNAMLDLSPLTNAIDGNRRNAMMAQQQDVQRQELGMRQQQMAMQQKRFDRDDEMATVKRLGMRAQAIDALPPNDPRRAQAWGAIMKEHPGGAGLDPSWHDPVQGPKMLIAETGQWQDPLQRQKLQAEVNKLNREASGTGPESYGKSGSVFQGPDGRFYSIQFGERGTRSIQPIEAPGQGPGPGAAGPPTAPTPLAPARGVTTVGDEVISNATGAPVRNVGEAIAGGERAKVVGRETGDLQFSMPKAQAALESANAKANIVRNKIAQARPLISNWSAGLGSTLARWPGSQARNLQEVINTIVANLGFDELGEMRANSPTGGALGQVAVQELSMLQKTKTSLETAQSVEQLQKAMDELEQFYAESGVRRRQAFEQTYAPVLNSREPRTGGFSPPAAASSGGWSIQRID